MEIVTWQPRYTPDFVRLNKQWIERYFKLEACDMVTLGDPKAVIIDAGGQIFFAKDGDTVVGCCALIHHSADNTYELAKMAVSPDAQGHGAGYALGQALIDYARSLGVCELFLEANTRLAASVHLYEKLGFVAVTDYHAEYERCNLFMRLNLR